jgi:processive 1,2-diacylglycerol beta-glucosyltransferase
MKKLDVVYFDAGSGHRSAAFGLASALRQMCPDWEVRTVNVVDAFAPNRRFQGIVKTGIDYFNWCMKRELLFDLRGLINLSLLFHDMVRRDAIQQMATFWADNTPDAVVSVTPMYNPVLYRSVRVARPDTICITIPVDFEEVRPRYWFTPKVEQHYLLATDQLIEQARRARIPEANLTRIVGMVIDPKFYSTPPANIPAELERLGLDPAVPTGVASFGGQGSNVLPRIARALDQPGLKPNIIFLCGRDEAAFNSISNLKTSYRKAVLRYTPEPPHFYYHIADFVLGKPGAMTITEALVTRKPIVFLKSRGMAPVQRGNETWVLKHGTGVAANGIGQLLPAIRQVMGSREYAENANRHGHHGVFSAVEQIKKIVCS